MNNEMDWINMLDVKTPQSVAEEIYEKISSLIISGKLPEGYMFPNENSFCKQLGIGRSTLREAYKMLELYGFITRSKRGTVVNEKKIIQFSVPMKKALEDADGEDFTGFRIMLEGENAFLASQNADCETISRLEQSMSELKQAAEKNDVSQLLGLDMDFHMLLSEITDNVLMINLMQSVSEIWKDNVKENFSEMSKSKRNYADQMLLQHQEIYEAVKMHDGKKARKLMIRHIRAMSWSNKNS